MAEEPPAVEIAEIPELPEVNELTVATVKRTTKYGAYLTLEEYPCDGFLHISQLSARWVRRVTHVIRTGQKIVVKVLRVDEKNNSVDVSLKDVPPSDGRRVMREWKMNLRGDQLLSDFAEKIGIEVEELDDKLEDVFTRHKTSYDALGRIVVEPSLLESTGLSKKEREEFFNYLSNRITPKVYRFEARIEVSSIGRGGVHQVREALGKIKEKAELTGLEATVTADGPPRYLVKLNSHKPELLRRHAKKIVTECLNESRKKGLISNLLSTS
ncbi:MAG: S1 RNA-binding domain-containing protein [Candidatus Geothermarchaeales archaeon]